MQLQRPVLGGRACHGRTVPYGLLLPRTIFKLPVRQLGSPWVPAGNPKCCREEFQRPCPVLRCVGPASAVVVAGGAGRPRALHSRNGNGWLASDIGLCTGARRRRKSGLQTAAAMEDGEKRSNADGQYQRWTLEQLDEQLKSLEDQDTEELQKPSEAERESLKPALKQLDEQLTELQRRESLASKRASGGWTDARESNGRVPLPVWPNFSTDFFVYTAIGLVLLTVVNNVLYRISFGPQVHEIKRSTRSDTPRASSLRVEGGEGRDAREEVLQSREAPLPSD